MMFYEAEVGTGSHFNLLWKVEICYCKVSDEGELIEEVETFKIFDSESKAKDWAYTYIKEHGEWTYYKRILEVPLRLANRTEPEPEHTDNVNHPEHYGGKDNPYETIKVIDAWKLGFSLGNAVKYISRAGKKDGNSMKQDLKKAMWYLEHELERVSKD